MMNHPRNRMLRNTLAGLAILLTVAGCGGGGGGGSKGGGGSTNPGGTQPTNPNPPGGTTVTAPDTTITTKPSAVSNSNSATFDATSSVSGSSFEASVDSGSFNAVTLPLTLTSLSEGNHTISIRAREAGGTVDDSPATYSWMVDTAGPTAAIVFPPRVSYTDANTLIVRGTSADANGISAITVNGIAATSTNGYESWAVEIPIATGKTEVVVAATDSLGNATASAASASVTNRGPVIAQNGGLVYDAATKRLIVADRASGQIYAVDENGIATVLLPRENGVPIPYHAIVLDAPRNRVLYLTSVTLNKLDLGSNQPGGISFCSNDTTIGMSKAENLAIDGNGSHAFLITSEDVPTVASIDLSTGDCTVIASGTVGSGAMLLRGSAIEYDGTTDPAHPRVLIGTLNSGDIVAIDLATNVRTLLPALNTGNHESTAEMKLDATRGRLLVLDSVQGALVAVDLQNGNRAVLAGQSVGSGPALRPSRGLAISDSGTVYAGQDAGDILRVDASTGARETFVQSQVGDGPPMTVSYGLSIEQPTGAPTSLLVSDLVSLSRIDLATGNRTVVSSATVGAGPYTGRIANFTIDTRTNHAGHAIGIMRGTDYSLVSIDLTSGDREKIADLNLPSAAHLANEVRVDAINNRAIIVDIDVTGSGNDALYAVDLSTGQRTTISDKSIGSGPALNFPSSLILEPASAPTRAIVSNGNDHNLLSIDLSTGTRTLFSSGTATQFLPGPLRLDSVAGRVLGADDYGFNLFSAPLSTGVPQVISGFDATVPKMFGRGPMLLGASGVAVDPSADVVYATQRNASSVMAIDLQTGDRVVISH